MKAATERAKGSRAPRARRGGGLAPPGQQWRAALETSSARVSIEERYRTLVENLPAVTYLAEADTAGFTIFISPQIREMAGFTPEEWTADPELWSKRIHPQDRQRVLAEWADSVEAGAPFRSKYRQLARDGRLIWCRDEAHPIHDETGRALYHGVVLDVTAEETEAALRREAEDALLRSEERYRSLFEHNLAGMYRSTFEGRILDCNAAFARIYGYAAVSELVGIDASRLLGDPDDRVKFVSQLARTRSLVNYETTGRRRDGSTVSLTESVSIVERQDGGQPQIEGLVLDVTERKQAEALLREESRVLERIAKREPLPDVLTAIALLAETQAPGMLCSVLLADEKGKTLRHGAAPSLPGSYCDAIDGAPIGPGVGCCGTAAYRRELVIVTDVATDPLWHDYREIALRHGLRACWSTPLVSASGRLLGTFGMYFREPRSPQAKERQLIEVAFRLAALAIDRYGAEEALWIRERQLVEAQRIAHLGSWEWDVAADVVACSDGLCQILGVLPRTDLCFEDFLKSVHSEDRVRVREILETSLRDGQPFEFQHRILRPDRTVRVLHARGEAAVDASGRVVRLYGIKQDITERTRAEARLARNLNRSQKLFEITAAVNRWAESSEVRELVLDALVHGIGADRASILLCDAAGVMRFAAWRGLSEAYRQAVEGHSPWTSDARNPEPIVVADVASAAELGPLRETLLDEGIRSLAFIPIFKDRLLGKFMLYYDAPHPPDEEEIQFALTVARHIGLATQRDRDDRARQASHDQMRRLAEHLQQAREEERTRIAREVHDELGQTLTALKLDLAWLKGRLARRPELAVRVAETSGLADAAIKTVRRIATALRPGVLDDLGLAPAVEWLAQDAEARTGIRCRLDPSFEVLVGEPEAATHIFRLFQEALTNVIRHSGASDAWLKLVREGSELLGEIRDNGRGISKQEASDPKALGLIGMRERARLLGGEVELAEGPSGGTVVRFRCPLRVVKPQESRAT